MISQKNKPVRKEGSKKWSFQGVFMAGFRVHNGQCGVINPQQLRIWEGDAEKLVRVEFWVSTTGSCPWQEVRIFKFKRTYHFYV